jgi:hypothetical protein
MATVAHRWRNTQLLTILKTHVFSYQGRGFHDTRGDSVTTAPNVLANSLLQTTDLQAYMSHNTFQSFSVIQNKTAVSHCYY